MAVENLTATKRGVGTVSVPASSHGLGGNLKVLAGTVEVSASASTTSTYLLGSLPSNARIHGLSRLHWDDHATTGAPTLDVGTSSDNNATATDDDGINDGLDLATATTGNALVKNIVDYGKQLYEFDASLSADPGGLMSIIGTIKDAAVTTGGTIQYEIVYSVD